MSFKFSKVSICFNDFVSSDFKVYWGVPSTSCRKYQIDFVNTVGNYGIIQNFNDSVRLGILIMF